MIDAVAEWVRNVARSCVQRVGLEVAAPWRGPFADPRADELEQRTAAQAERDAAREEIAREFEAARA